MSSEPSPADTAPLAPIPDLGISLQLLGRARGGDTLALNDLIARYYDRVRSIVRIRMGEQLRLATESCDLTQQTMQVAAKKLATFEPRSQRAFLQWLAAIAENQIRDAVDRMRAEKRDLGREVPLEIPGANSESVVDRALRDRGPSPSAVLTAAELREAYDACVAALPEEQRTLVLLRVYEGASMEELRAATGSPSLDAVEQRYYRARMKLAEMLRLRNVQ